jgi:hypothetical protein
MSPDADRDDVVSAGSLPDVTVVDVMDPVIFS